MAATVIVNNLTLAHKSSSGATMATLPDVCKTPSPGGPVPMPYPNVTRSATLTDGTTTVKANGAKICAIKGSKFSSSQGDEAGTAGGVKSSVNMKAAEWITYSFDVKLEGKNACRLTDKMFHNDQNTANLAGEIQDFGLGEELNLLCTIFCKALRKYEKQRTANPRPSKIAEKLGKGEYKQALAKYGLECEKSIWVALTSSLKNIVLSFGRKLISRASAVAAVGADIVNPGFGYARVKPDVAKFAGDVPKKIYDYKFPGDSFRKGQDKLFKRATGKDPIAIDEKKCNNCPDPE